MLTHIVNRLWGVLALTALLTSAAQAEKPYGPGVSDTEIKLGQSTPLSGPAFMIWSSSPASTCALV